VAQKGLCPSPGNIFFSLFLLLTLFLLAFAVLPRYPGNVALGVPVASSSPAHPPGYPLAYPLTLQPSPQAQCSGFSSEGQAPGVHLGMSAPGGASVSPPPMHRGGFGLGPTSRRRGAAQAPGRVRSSTWGQGIRMGGRAAGGAGAGEWGSRGCGSGGEPVSGVPDRMEGAADQSVDIAGLNDMLTLPLPVTNGTSFYTDHEGEFKQEQADGGGLGQGEHNGQEQQNHHESSFPPMAQAGQGEGVHEPGGEDTGNHVGDFSSLDGGHPESLLLMDEGEHHWLS